MKTKRVPLEPTREMLDAALRLYYGDFYAEARVTWDAVLRKRWAAMVEAAPDCDADIEGSA